MDVCLGICMGKLYQCRNRRCRYALKALNSIEKIQLGMMVAMFNGNLNAIIISCYSPTNVSEETGLITFYNKLSSLVRSILKHNILIICGDINAQIGKNINKFSLDNSSNGNGEYLTDFIQENRLTGLHMKFQKLWTYTYANSAKAQIHYIHINKKWNNSATFNCKIYSSFDSVASNH